MGTWARELSQDCVVFVKVHCRSCGDLFIAIVYVMIWFVWCVAYVGELIGEFIGCCSCCSFFGDHPLIMNCCLFFCS